MLIKKCVTEEAPARHSTELLNLLLLWMKVGIWGSLLEQFHLINEPKSGKLPTSHRRDGKDRRLGTKGSFTHSHAET